MIEKMKKQIDSLKQELRLNAKLLGRQCDMAREAETELDKFKKNLLSEEEEHNTTMTELETLREKVRQANNYLSGIVPEAYYCKSLIQRTKANGADAVKLQIRMVGSDQYAAEKMLGKSD